jgi:predicted secreted protein
MDNTLNNIVSFTISADQDVDQDFISISFTAAVTDPSANTVQEILAARLKDALTIARSKEVKGKVDVKSGLFQVSPIYDKKGVITGYTGNVSLLVSGTDTKTILELTGLIKTMTVGDVQQSISAALRKQVEQDLAIAAIKQWREKSKTYSDAFGSTSFKLVNADIRYNNRYPTFARAMSASLESVGSSGEISAEPGVETLTITITGTIQLH